MTHGNAPRTAVPGVVDGSLTVFPGADREVSFHVELGHLTGQGAQFEFTLRSEDVAAVRAALTADADQMPILGSVPCQIGIRICR